MGSDVFEVVWPAVFLGQERLAIIEFAGGAAGTLGGVGAVEVGGMTVPNVAEPEDTRSQYYSKPHANGRLLQHTNEPWLHLQANPEQLSEQAHRPISHRKIHRPGPSAQNTLHTSHSGRSPSHQFRNWTKNGR